MPALLKTTSSRPKLSTAWRMSASTASGSVTSTRRKPTPPSAPASSFATALPPASSMSASTRRAPSARKRRAVARPIPDAAPVITATLPSSRLVISTSSLCDSQRSILRAPVRAPMPTDPHPRGFRRSILATALVAMATWWGLGLPYSLFGWLLDPRQLRWVLVCYAWEVPVAGLLGPVAFPLLWFRDIERRWDATFRADGPVDPAAAAALEGTILDFPVRVAWVFLITSLVGYGVGAIQVGLFAQTPVAELVKILALGLATGLTGGLFAFLYLESLLAPL